VLKLALLPGVGGFFAPRARLFALRARHGTMSGARLGRGRGAVRRGVLRPETRIAAEP
jgi:hypothetical protein